MIKNSVTILYPVYHKLCNLILQSGIYPDAWGEGSITPIFKSGTRSDPNNYSGICVSGCIGKVFCSIINQRLLSYIQESNILHKPQVSLLPHQRTSDHIFTLRCIRDKSQWRKSICVFYRFQESLWLRLASRHAFQTTSK